MQTGEIGWVKGWLACLAGPEAAAVRRVKQAGTTPQPANPASTSANSTAAP